jgi:tetratricopeptide (TPR) repeat protein
VLTLEAALQDTLPTLRALNVFIPSGDLGRALAYLREAETLAAALDDPRRLGQVYAFLANYFYIMGAPDQAIAAGQHALALATASGEVVLQTIANYFLGFAHWLQGDYHRRRRERFGQWICLVMCSSR